MIDLTTLAVSVTGGVFSVLGIVAPLWIASHIKDKTAAGVVAAAVKNSLGTLQQVATSEINTLHPAFNGVPAALAPGVQYVLDQAGPEATRLGITPVAVAQKIEAQIGLANIATNLAVTASPAPLVVAPLAPVPTKLPEAASPVLVVGTAAPRSA